MQPQLAKTVDPKIALSRITDDDWLACQKADGVRLLITTEGDKLYGWNRRGDKADIPRAIAAGFESFSGSWAFDGELLSNGVWWIFDMPVAQGVCGNLDMGSINLSPNFKYEDRRTVLEMLFPLMFSTTEQIGLLPVYQFTQDKSSLAKSILESNGEGLILNHKDAKYQPGVRSTDMLKLKYTKTLDCIVGEKYREGKMSMSVNLFNPDGDELVDVGSVTMTEANLSKVERGDVVEIRVLNVQSTSPERYRLYQPAFIGIRTDKEAIECNIQQAIDLVADKTIKEQPLASSTSV